MSLDASWTQRIGDAVRAVRLNRGLSARVLALRTMDIGYLVPRNTITNLENGRRESVTVHEIAALAQALEVPVTALLGGDALDGDYDAGYRDGVRAERERIRKALEESS